MSIHQKAASNCVLHITITNLIYQVTEDVLISSLMPMGCMICVSRINPCTWRCLWSSNHGRRRAAKDALHGGCIYDGCSFLDIQHAPSSISFITLPNSKSFVVDFDCVEMAPPTSVQVAVQGASPPMPSSNAEVVKPMMLLTPAKSEVQSTLTSLAPLMISMEPSLDNRFSGALPLSSTC
uniref:PTBP1-like RNA recognition motif 2 domain-containing protein n=1 Tax=Aegilops tauschii subsp. strangulata TaxID=200361 RepID=A0A453NTB9_AEGTS